MRQKWMYEDLVWNLYYWCKHPPSSVLLYIFSIPRQKRFKKITFCNLRTRNEISPRSEQRSRPPVLLSSSPPVLPRRPPPPPTHIITLCLMPTVQKNFTRRQRRQRQQSTYSKCKSKVKKFQFHLIIIFHSISLYHDERERKVEQGGERNKIKKSRQLRDGMRLGWRYRVFSLEN